MLNIFRHACPFFAWVIILLGTMFSAPDVIAQNAGMENAGADADADADAAEIRAMLEDRDDAIKSILGGSDSISDEQREQLRGLINDVIDFEAMGAGALGRYWSKISGDEQIEFVSVFAQIVRIQSLADVDVYRSSVVYDDISVEGENATVRTTTTYKSVPTPVEYSLHKTPDGWKATDIILDDVSTVKGYARSFQSVVRKKGFDDLMVRLNNRLETEKAASASK
jgi:phospholipid transport system substrate-binding protein